MLYEILSLDLPFAEERFQSRVEDKVLAGERPPIQENWSSSLVKTMTTCWAQEPDDRPTFSEILNQMTR